VLNDSGSGKSTVVRLIQRFYDVDAGTITLDGIDITHLPLSWLRSSQLGYVPQEPQLCGMSIRDNVTYGLSDSEQNTTTEPMVTQSELEQACRDANAHDYLIVAWPDGYDTMVGERGITWSWGQQH